MRAWIYDRALMGLTPEWYREVLERMPEGAHLLDIGIGTGGALCRNAKLMIDKDIRVTGVDIDAAYLEQCQRRIEELGLTDRVTALHESIYDHKGGPYDAAYFSASFMLLPDSVAALEHVLTLLTPEGKVFFTQTFHDKKSPIMERVKPLLHRITTIHFGKVTYEQDFRDALASAGVTLDEMKTMGRTRTSSYRLAVATPGDA
jgi:ubiquinone/menaquinone biosynthesis C-methylase UbiE